MKKGQRRSVVLPTAALFGFAAMVAALPDEVDTPHIDALAAAPALSAEGSVYGAYLTLVERSCAQRDEAIHALFRWSAEALGEVEQKLYECDQCRKSWRERLRGPPLEVSDQVGPDRAGVEAFGLSTATVDEDCGCESPPWAAAAVLHTLRALTSWPGASNRSHLALAARLQEQLPDDAFRRRWYLAAGLGSLYRVDIGPARSYLEQGLELFEDDPALLVALGASYEVEEWHNRLTVRGAGSGRSHGPFGAENRYTRERQEMAERTRRWQEAAGLYEKALDHDPEHPEAHLRLGRVELLLGRSDQGLAKLRWVTEHAKEPDLIYLAHLFIGRDLKRSGQLDAALTAYRAALKTDPRGQAAYVATSQALHMSGNPGAAAEVLERGLAARRHTLVRDSWWRYPESRLGQVPELLTRLHEEVCR